VIKKSRAKRKRAVVDRDAVLRDVQSVRAVDLLTPSVMNAISELSEQRQARYLGRLKEETSRIVPSRRRRRGSALKTAPKRFP
jgi:hypothetical protein